MMAILALVSATTPRAQTAPRAEPPAVAAPALVSDLDGGVRVEAARYRARFSSAGMELCPALGRAHPRTESVALTFVSLGREPGSHLADAQSARPRTTASVVEFRRGIGVVERWHARTDGIELTLTLASPLPGAGDLVARYRLSSSLAPIVGQPDGSLRLGGARGARIGALVGIDAAGRTTPGTLSVDGDWLELRLPAAFVDRAAYPLVLDPLVAPDFAVAPLGDDALPDVAYEATSQSWLVVWERTLSATDIDIIGQRLDLAGNPLGALLSFETGPAMSFGPRAAAVRARGRVVVVWHEGALFAPWEVRARCMNSDGTLSAAVTVVEPKDLAQHTVLAGNAATFSTAGLLVYASGAHVLARRLDVPAGTAAPAPGPPVQVVAGASASRLAISKSGGVDARWLVLWRGNGAVGSNLHAQMLDENAAKLGPPTSAFSALLLVDDSPIAVDGNGEYFVLAWHIVSIDGIDVQLLRWDRLLGQLVVAAPRRNVGDDPASTEFEPSVAWLGPKVLVTWTARTTNLLADIRGLAVDPASCLPCDVEFAIPRPATREFGSAAVARAATDPSAGTDALIAFTSTVMALPFPSEVRAQRFAAFGTDGRLTRQGGLCGGSFVASANGPISIGNANLVLTVSGVAGASSVALNVGVPGPPIVCGPCQITPPIATLPAGLGAGVAQAAVPIPCSPSLIGGVLEVQWLVVGVPTSPCPLAPGLGLSDRLHLQIGS
jgi:hypothetical protein